MATIKKMKVAALSIDLTNYRTVPQPDEEHATTALISIHSKYFWGLMESLLEDGYNPTENIVVLKKGGKHVVKEGNRRVASLKLIHGITKNVEIPWDIQEQIDMLQSGWKKENATIPCVVYPAKEATFVDKLVARTHAKGNTAGRDKWNSVARARYARDQLKKSEPCLDILEKYLVSGKNRTPEQAEEWSGEFPFTVLNEALQKLMPVLKAKSATTLASAYPGKHKRIFDGVLYDIGTKTIGFKEIRARSQSWITKYGLSVPTPSGSQSGSQPSSAGSSGGGAASGSSAGVKKKAASAKTYPSNDPISVRKQLTSFKVTGVGRGKIATLKKEISTLNIKNHPHAFCFLLRSLFELSAKAYCADHGKSGGPNPKKKDGTDKSLAHILREIVKHLTNNRSDKAKVKLLHGAITELAKPDGLLSVTSMNQLVHHPSFSVSPSDICILFGNVFPLLEAMNS